MTLALVLIGMMVMFFVEQVNAQHNRAIELNDSTLIVVNNNNIIEAKTVDWALIPKHESVFDLSDLEIINLFQTGKITTKGSWTHNIEKELFPVLRGDEMDKFTHWEISDGFLETKTENTITGNSKVNKVGTIALWWGLLCGLLMVLLLFNEQQVRKVGRETRIKIYTSVSLTHIFSLTIIVGLGWLYETFPSVFMGIVVFVGFIIMVIISSSPAVFANSELSLGDSLIVASLGFFVFLGLIILAVPAKLSLAVLVFPVLLFFGGYLIAEILMIFNSEGEINLAKNH
ncbi:MAG: hypothetical protein WD552_00765 [Candidatus Paceibacterota bacterium]